MIRDFRTFDATDELVCDLCIAGAGAAGITLARAFAGRGERVVVLESGGIEAEGAIQALNAGASIGQDYDLEMSRMRALGGATGHWGGMCALLDRRDFAAREEIDHSGWPIERSAIDPFYPEAHEILDLGAFEHDPRRLETPGAGLMPVDPARLAPRLFRYSDGPAHLGPKYRRLLEQADNVTVLLHANLTEIELAAPDGPVAAFRVTSLDGRSARVRARAFVLALGGIENPRLMLASNRILPTGVGNRRNWVGRCFMEHTGGIVGTAAWSGAGYEEAYQQFHHGPIRVHHALAPSDRLLHEAGILNISIGFGTAETKRRSSAGYTALREVKDSFVDGRIPDDLGAHIWSMITDLDGLVMGVFERFDSTTHVLIEGEQAPNPDSRVLLGSERDRLDLPQAVLDWRLAPIDKRTVRVVTETLAEELGRTGAGRMQIQDWVTAGDDEWGDALTPSFHHMGTTRMADDPDRGVVDADCRVFGCDNLYVAGSSVFATSGFANPTLNIVAMTLRLAEHLKARLDVPEAPLTLHIRPAAGDGT